MKKGAWRVVGLLCLVAILGGIALIWLALRMEARQLLDIAHPIRTGHFQRHAWQSDHVLVTLAAAEKQTSQVTTNDLAAGTRRDLCTLSLPSMQDGPDLIAISPNGLWLASLSWSTNDYNANGSLEVQELGGDHSCTLGWYGFQNGAPPSMAWLPDSRRMVAVQKTDHGFQAELRSMDTPDAEGVSVSLPAAAKALLGVTPDMHLISTDLALQPGQNTAKITVFSVGLLPNLDPQHQFVITLPADTSVEELVLSPQGNRLAWILDFSRIHPLRRLLSRLIPTLGKNNKPERGTALYVSRLDGQQLTQIGFQPFDKKAKEIPHDLHWTPDGKQLSFLYRKGIYAVTAP